MTHVAANADVIEVPDHPGMRDENIRLHSAPMASIYIGVGGLLLAGVAILGATGMVHPKHAMTSVLVGILSTLGICLGALFFTMVFSLTNSGWSTTIRRQFENLFRTMWLPAGLFGVWVVIELASGGIVSSWMSEHAKDDPVFAHKSVYFNKGFVIARLLLYTAVFGIIAQMLWHYSTEQDRTGNKWLSNRARFHSSWGMLAFALCSAFFAFDWMMALTDYHFYSTMWGVYFFAGAAYASVPTVVLILAALRRKGLLEGIVGEEHLHDLGKLMFAFTVFWAYIAFGQYFLIWYGNIPEETAWFAWRKNADWNPLTIFLVVGHFIIPFYFLLWRRIRRSFGLLAAFAGWGIFMHVIDIYWVLRPSVYTGELLGDSPDPVTSIIVDAGGIVGVLALFTGFVMRQVSTGSLVPLRDPRLPEALKHKNYV